MDKLLLKDDFYYSTNTEISVRKRIGDPPANIEIISPEEIEKAVHMVIETQFATTSDDLVTQVARLFGFRSTSKKTGNKIKEIIDFSIDNGNLVEMPNGMLNIPK